MREISYQFLLPCGSDWFCNFYFVKNHKIAKNSTTTKEREKISEDLELFMYV
jgi:hypothetical protein